MATASATQADTKEPNTKRLNGTRRWFVWLPPALVAGVATTLLIVSGSSAAGDAPVVKAEVLAEYPHDSSAFCQGLVVRNGALVESTGRLGQSRLRRVDPESGRVLKEIKLRDDIFAEGITIFNNDLIQLTWRNREIYIWDADTFEYRRTLPLKSVDRELREGWGITHDGQQLILSDGSHTLRFIDPTSFRLIRRLIVREGRKTIRNLNELEWVNGEILANVWYDRRIARIDPESGQVRAWIDMQHAVPAAVRRDREAVLNGIAWDPESERLYVTGKNWPSLFVIRP